MSYNTYLLAVFHEFLRYLYKLLQFLGHVAVELEGRAVVR